MSPPIRSGALVAVAVAAVAHAAPPTPATTLINAARTLASANTTYEPSYRQLAYPAGDPPADVGVCTDLVVRAYRALGVDLQVLVHEDMTKRFSDYHTRKKQTRPDPNIDHRRVRRLVTFFDRHAVSLGRTLDAKWQPGDIVIFDLYDNGGFSHIGIISDRRAPSGRPLVFHHFPPYPAEEDCLDDWTISGHYRYFPRLGTTPGRTSR